MTEPLSKNINHGIGGSGQALENLSEKYPESTSISEIVHKESQEGKKSGGLLQVRRQHDHITKVASVPPQTNTNLAGRVPLGKDEILSHIRENQSIDLPQTNTNLAGRVPLGKDEILSHI